MGCGKSKHDVASGNTMTKSESRISKRQDPTKENNGVEVAKPETVTTNGTNESNSLVQESENPKADSIKRANERELNEKIKDETPKVEKKPENAVEEKGLVEEGKKTETKNETKEAVPAVKPAAPGAAAPTATIAAEQEKSPEANQEKKEVVPAVEPEGPAAAAATEQEKTPEENQEREEVVPAVEPEAPAAAATEQEKTPEGSVADPSAKEAKKN